MKKRLLSTCLVLALCLGLLPAGVLAAEDDPYDEFTGESTIPTQTYEDLDFNTGTTELEQIAGSDERPYGRGYTSLVPKHELVTAAGTNADPQLILSDVEVGSSAFTTKTAKTYYATDSRPGETIAMRTQSIDPDGMGKTGVVATLSMRTLRDDGKDISVLFLGLDGASGQWKGKNKNIELTMIPFKLYPENAGAYMSMAAGNFDGDEYNTQELAVYLPFSGKTYSGVIEIYRITKDLELETIKTLELREQSGYYFPDNSAALPNFDRWGWIYQYTQPALSLETVAQPGDKADDLCVTFSAALGGGAVVANNRGDAWLKEQGITINPKRPYDAATGVFFWIDPATSGAKRTGTNQMRYNWAEDYNVSTTLDKYAEDKWEVMYFGSAGAGDMDGDGYAEVVVAGYTNSDRYGVMTDLSSQPSHVASPLVASYFDISEVEYMATFFTYDPEANTYRQTGQPASWVNIESLNHSGILGLGERVYTNYGDKDLLHQPLEVTCFADRGSGYTEAVAMGGVICRLDGNANVSAWTPYQNEGMGMASFEHGSFAPLYAIPEVYTHWYPAGGRAIDPGNVQNRLFTETEAINVDGDTHGLERLAFNYVYKRYNGAYYHSWSGVIGQKASGEQAVVGNRNTAAETIAKKDSFGDLSDWEKQVHFLTKSYNDVRSVNVPSAYLSDALIMSAWHNPLTAGTVAAADIDDDSLLIRPGANEDGESASYYFSDPRVLAVLQAAPYFEDLNHDDGYGADSGGTKIAFSSGNESSQITYGLNFNAEGQAGAKASFKLFGFETEAKILAGASGGFEKTEGSFTTTLHYQTYTASMNNMVALVMTPYVRYYYEAYDPDTKKWGPLEVDVPLQPRATTVSADQYDAAAAAYNATLPGGDLDPMAWEYIDGNILNNIEGDPSSYDSRRGNKSNYRSGVAVGADTPDNFVKVGSGDGDLMSQGISEESGKSKDYTWSVGAVISEEVEIGNFASSFSQEIGATGGYGSVSFSGTEFEGEVLSIPTGYEDYTFYWNFGTWDDTMSIQGHEQTFPVLGFLVSGVRQPAPTFPTSYGDPMLHVVTNGTRALQLSWANALGEERRMAAKELGYALYRYQHGAYYPLAMLPASAAEDGWFTYTDRYASPFEEYGYAVRPYALLATEKYAYGAYSDTIDAYTVTDDENRPQVTVAEMEDEMGRVYTATITPATGDVGDPFIQWQVYDRDNGGWIDIPEGHGLTSLAVTGSANLEKEYRCYVTQRVGEEIYVVYSDVQVSGYVFVAHKSGTYQKDGMTVVDYVLVHEDGALEVVSSPNTRYNTKYVYAYGYGEDGELLLQINENTRQRRSVSLAESGRAEVDGGSRWAASGGHGFAITGNSAVWDVKKLMDQLSKSALPLLSGGQDPAAVAKTLPAVTVKTLAEKDYISYSCDGEDTLRAAFVHGTMSWIEPRSFTATPVCLCAGDYVDEETGKPVYACDDNPDCHHTCCPK